MVSAKPNVSNLTNLSTESNTPTCSSEHLVQTIQSCRTFKTNQHKLANVLHIPDVDAKTELIAEILSNRLPTDCFINEIEDMINNHSPKLMWGITYARLDIQKEYFKDRNHNDHVSLDESIVMRSDELLSDRNIDDVVALLPKLFSHHATVDFISSVLLNGKDETMDELHISSHQFNDKLLWIERYCKNHRDKLYGLIKTRDDEQLIRKRNLLQDMVDILESVTDNTDDAMSDYLSSHHTDVIDDLLDDPGIHHEAEVIENFGNDHHDCYEFVDNVYDTLSVINDEIARR